MSLSSAGVLTTSSNIVSGGNVVIADAGNIGSASDTDAIAIASNGVVTFSQAVSGTSADFDSGVTIDNITIDGTEIDLSSGDLTLDVAGDIILDAVLTDTGSYEVNIIAPNVYWDLTTCQMLNFPVDVENFDTVFLDYPIQAEIICPVMEVDVSTSRIICVSINNPKITWLS